MRLPLALGVVFVAALALRLAYVESARHFVTFDSPLVDAWVYDRDARRIASEGLTALELPFYQPPGYPLALGGLYALTGGSYLAPRILQALLGAATVAMVFALALRGGGWRAAWIAAGLLGLYGPVLYFEGELLPPAWILFLDTAALLLLATAEGRPADRARTGLAALLLGVSTVFRPTAALLALGAAAWRFRRGSRRAAPLAAAAYLLPLLPIAAANLAGGREPVPISWNGGINFYLGNGSNPDSLTAIQPGFAWDRLQREPLRAGVHTRAGESAYWTRRALREAASDPGGWTAALGRKALRLLDARETPRNTDWEAFRPDSVVLSLPLVGFGLLAPLAFLGLGARGPDRRIRSLLAVTAGAIAIENLLFFVAGRYRLQAVPALAVLGGLGADALLRTGVRAFPRRVLVGCAVLLVVVHVDLLGERQIDEARAAINRGVALRRKGLESTATREFVRALRASPHDADAHRWLGETALGSGQAAAALEHYDQALAVAPDYLRVLLGKAQALERLGRGADAEAVYARALEVDPWSTEVRLNYGVFLAIAGRSDEARRMFEEGLRIDPDEPRLRRNLDRLRRGS